MIVQNMNILRAMERRGLVELSPATGRTVTHWTGMPVRAYYVEGEGKNANGRYFDYKGDAYKITYIDGCFYPFVVKEKTGSPQFV